MQLHKQLVHTKSVADTMCKCSQIHSNSLRTSQKRNNFLLHLLRPLGRSYHFKRLCGKIQSTASRDNQQAQIIPRDDEWMNYHPLAGFDHTSTTATALVPNGVVRTAAFLEARCSVTTGAVVVGEHCDQAPCARGGQGKVRCQHEHSSSADMHTPCITAERGDQRVQYKCICTLCIVLKLMLQYGLGNRRQTTRKNILEVLLK